MSFVTSATFVKLGSIAKRRAYGNAGVKNGRSAAQYVKAGTTALARLDVHTIEDATIEAVLELELWAGSGYPAGMIGKFFELAEIVDADARNVAIDNFVLGCAVANGFRTVTRRDMTEEARRQATWENDLLFTPDARPMRTVARMGGYVAAPEVDRLSEKAFRTDAAGNLLYPIVAAYALLDCSMIALAARLYDGRTSGPMREKAKARLAADYARMIESDESISADVESLEGMVYAR